MISAGRVLLMPKGDYDPTATYEMLDIVSYNGSSYIAKSTTTGNLPTNTTYWQLSAYGGQAANLAGNFAPLETTEYATRAYVADDIFVDKDSQLVIATTTINIGDEIEIGSNCDVTTMAELLDAIENRYDALDQRNRKLVGINPITIQTDLHLLAPGEYFKKLTNFYVTNAPTGINQVPTAIFRLTVESGLDESGSSLLLTLRATDGKVYTQSYDGTSWSAWVEVSSKAYVDNGLALKANIADLGTAAYKDSTNAVTSGSTDLVESGAVYSEIQSLDNSKAAKTQITNPNLLDNPWFTVNQRGATSVTTTWTHFADRWRTGNNAYNLVINNDKTITFKAGGITEINQAIEYDRFNLGKVYTLSVMLSNGTIRSVSGVIEQKSQWTRLFAVKLSDTDDIWASIDVDQIYVAASIYAPTDLTADLTIKAMKLELGSVSTLAMDTAPNYQQELAKCQRYFQIIGKTGTAYLGKTLAVGPAYNTKNLWMPYNLPVPLRTYPTIKIVGDFYVTASGASSPVATTQNGLIIGVVNFGEKDISQINISLDDSNDPFTVGTFYKLATLVKDEEDYIELSADL